MSHQPSHCSNGHTFGPWTSEEVTNSAGETQYILQHFCYACGLVEVEPAMVKDEQ